MTAVAAAWDRLLKLCAALVGVLLLFATASVVAEVVGRYFFNSPIGWVLETTEHILLYTPFLGMAWLVQRAEGHVRIDIMLQAFSPATRNLVDAVVCTLTAVVCGIAAFYAGWTTWDHYERAVLTYGIYPIPKWMLLVVIAFGFALTTVEFLRKGARHLGAWRAA